MNEMIYALVKNMIIDKVEYAKWLELYGIKGLRVIETLTKELNEF